MIMNADIINGFLTGLILSVGLIVANPDISFPRFMVLLFFITVGLGLVNLFAPIDWR